MVNLAIFLYDVFIECETLLTCEVFVRVLNIKSAALADHVQVFSGLQNLLLVLCEEDRDHLLPVCESFDPVLVVQIDFDVLLQAALVLSHYELLKGVL